MCDKDPGLIQLALSWLVFVISIGLQLAVMRRLRSEHYKRYSAGDQETRVGMGLLALVVAFIFFGVYGLSFGCL